MEELRVDGVMKDKELTLKQIEASHTLGGAGTGVCPTRLSEVLQFIVVASRSTLGRENP